MTEKVELYRSQIALARTEIKNLRHKISAIKHEHRKEIEYIKDILDRLKCSNCASEATAIVNQNNFNNTSVISEAECIVFQPIGHIHTMFDNKRAVPRQPTLLTKSSGTVVINPDVFSNPAHALEGLEEFSHMWLLYHFHKKESSRTPAKVTPPRLGERRGVFSTRSPHRPCPIGMSLVKIQSIEGNKIYFLGIDMVDGTPLLDIKPYIPQYDYPAMFESSIMSQIRPPTEGISDVLEPVSNLQIDEDDYGTSSLNPHLNQIAVDTDSPLRRSPYDEDILSPDNQDPLSNIMPASSQSSDSPSSVDLVDGAQPSPTRRLQTERGAPDGQERFTPPQSNLLNANYDGIRVASWIANPPSQRYHVTFNDDAFARLHELIGARAEPFKTNIECLLSEDPRSLYVRTRYPDHEYSCVLEDLSISCLFDATAGVCTIVAVRSAEELQEN